MTAIIEKKYSTLTLIYVQIGILPYKYVLQCNDCIQLNKNQHNCMHVDITQILFGHQPLLDVNALHASMQRCIDRVYACHLIQDITTL